MGLFYHVAEDGASLISMLNEKDPLLGREAHCEGREEREVLKL